MTDPTPLESICIVRLSAIGDTCHALAVVRAIQDAWPETRLTWIIGKTEAGLMADIPDVEFIIFDKRKGREGYRELRTSLAERKFDAVLCMHASMRVNPIYRMLRAAVKLGFDFRRARDFQWLFTNQRIDATPRQHVLDGMMQFARHIKVPEKSLRWDIPLTEAQREFARDIVAADRPNVLISPCSSNRSRNFRNWSAENYAAAANHAQQKFGARVILSGGGSELEAEYAQTIQRLAGDDTVNLVGKTSLKELLAVIAQCSVVVCPDSGPAHMATAAGTPVVGLYATSNPDRSGPYLSRELTVNAYPEAVQRFLGKSVDKLRWGQRVRDAGAMGLIRLKDVNARLDQVLAK